MEVTINIEDYLTKEELKEIAIDEARKAVRDKIRTTGKMEQFLTNLSYSIIAKDIDEQIPNYKDTIIAGIQKCLDGGYQMYHVFRPKDMSDREESLGWRYVQNTIRDNKELIEQRVKDCIANYDMTQFINQKMYDALSELCNSAGNVASHIWNMMNPNDKI